jgi:hypothetical protein
MSIRVYGSEQNPAVDVFLYRCSNSSGASLIASGGGFMITDGDGRRAIQLKVSTTTKAESRESIGRSALIPFGRAQNPMLAPKPLHYEIPMAGDRTCFARHRRRLIPVSSRSMFSHQVLPVVGEFQ